MNEHRRFQGDLSKKLKLMQAAVAALPEVRFLFSLSANSHTRGPATTRTPPRLSARPSDAFSQELREAALEPDMAPIPAKRQIPLATPNIEGWYEGKQKEAEAATGLGGAKRR